MFYLWTAWTKGKLFKWVLSIQRLNTAIIWIAFKKTEVVWASLMCLQLPMWKLLLIIELGHWTRNQSLTWKYSLNVKLEHCLHEPSKLGHGSPQVCFHLEGNIIAFLQGMQSSSLDFGTVKTAYKESECQLLHCQGGQGCRLVILFNHPDNNSQDYCYSSESCFRSQLHVRCFLYPSLLWQWMVECAWHSFAWPCLSLPAWMLGIKFSPFFPLVLRLSFLSPPLLICGFLDCVYIYIFYWELWRKGNWGMVNSLWDGWLVARRQEKEKRIWLIQFVVKMKKWRCDAEFHNFYDASHCTKIQFV